MKLVCHFLRCTSRASNTFRIVPLCSVGVTTCELTLRSTSSSVFFCILFFGMAWSCSACFAMLPSAPPMVTQPRAEPVVQPDVGSAAQPHVEAAAQPVVDTAAQPEVDSVAQPDVDAVAQPGVDSVAQSPAEPVAQPEVDSVAQSPAEPVAEPEVDSVAQPHVEAKAQAAVEAVEQHAAPDEAPTVASDRFTTTGALLATVADGSVRPLSGKYLIRLAEGWMGIWAKIFDFYPASFDGSPFLMRSRKSPC